MDKTFKWNSRHIIVDHAGKRILIQVMWDQTGHINMEEFKQIKKGNYAQFLPQNLDAVSNSVRQEIRSLIASNYRVEPTFFQGIQSNEHSVIQMTPIEEPKVIDLQLH
jgi:hypothetical protein